MQQNPDTNHIMVYFKFNLNVCHKDAEVLSATGSQLLLISMHPQNFLCPCINAADTIPLNKISRIDNNFCKMCLLRGMFVFSVQIAKTGYSGNGLWLIVVIIWLNWFSPEFKKYFLLRWNSFTKNNRQ